MATTIEMPESVRCACGSYSTWERPVFGSGGEARSRSLVWQGCGNRKHASPALGTPVAEVVFKRWARANKAEG